MDPNPTPFPGKHRRAAVSINKEKSEGKSSKEANVVPARFRQTRVFGTVRSTNVPVEKPITKPSLLKISKPLKCSTSLAKPTVRDGTRKINSTKPAQNPIRVSKNVVKYKMRKPTAVSFKESLPLEISSGNSILDDGPHTPITSSNNIMMLETPFHSAQDFSKCCLDRLESASYWITQIELAELVGKHFVSIAFFRLAKECKAEPSQMLTKELKSYMHRHSSVLIGWHEVCQLYGLMDDKPNIGFHGHEATSSAVDGNLTHNMHHGLSREENKDAYMRDDSTSIPFLDIPKEGELENPIIGPLVLMGTSRNEALVDTSKGEPVSRSGLMSNGFDLSPLKDKPSENVSSGATLKTIPDIANEKQSHENSCHDLPDGASSPGKYIPSEESLSKSGVMLKSERTSHEKSRAATVKSKGRPLGTVTSPKLSKTSIAYSTSEKNSNNKIS